MKTSVLLLAAVTLSLAPAMHAQDSQEPKLTVKPTGRILLDGALFASPDKGHFKDGVALPDARLGAKATYGKWSAKIDVGFANGKVGLKDLFIQYDFDDENLIRGGSFIHQYGLQSSTSSSMKCTYEEPLSNSVFNCSRQIGVMYVHNEDKFLGTFSAHVEPQSVILTPNQLNGEGYGLISRLVARPVHSDGNVVQVGISGGFTTPQSGGDDHPHNSFSFGCNFPTRVDKVSALSVTLNDAMNQWKFTPELLLATGPVALEAQYFFNRVNFREGLHSFTGQGAYATLRGLLTGGSYGYSMADGGLATPDKGTLEFVAGYNFTTLNDKKAQYISDGQVFSGIYGGSANTISATLNYYINKYMLARLNYTYTHTYNSAKLCTDLNAFQVRLQILF